MYDTITIQMAVILSYDNNIILILIISLKHKQTEERRW